MPYFITKAEITGLSTGAWTTKDISAFLPGGTTGVTGIMLHYVNIGSGRNAVGWRKNGSSDNRTGTMTGYSQGNAFVGVDGSNQFQYYIGHSDVKIWFVGYFKSEAVFFTNATNKTPGVTGSYQTIDISADTGADTAIAAMFEIDASGGDNFMGIRKKGSTDDRYHYFSLRHGGAIIGVDASEQLEAKINSTNMKIYLVGFITSGATFNTNATDYSLGSTGAYADLSALPEGATGGFFEVYSTAYDLAASLRENGAGEDLYQNPVDVCHLAVKCDANRLVEGKIESTNVDFWLLGYGTQEEPPPTPSTSSRRRMAWLIW